MSHKPDCKCPPCRYARGEGSTAGHFTVRLDQKTIDWIRTRQEGARAYIERLIRDRIDKMLCDAREALTEMLDSGVHNGPHLANTAQEVDDLRYEIEAGRVPDVVNLLRVEQRLKEAIEKSRGAKTS